MKIKTHPMHMDIGGISRGSSYSKTMGRFEFILQNKLGVSKPQRVLPDFSPESSEKLTLKASEIVADVKQKSVGAADKIDAYFKDTPLKNLGSAFEKAQDKYGVNAFFLASIAGLESGNGTSRIAKDKRNLFGFGAFDDSPYESAKSFSSFEEGIDKVAKYLSEEYLHENGNYYRGNSTEDINKSYATDKNWHKKINRIIDKMTE